MVVKQSKFSSKSSQRFIQDCNQLATPLPLILKTTGSSEVPAPRAIGAGDDEVVGGGGGGLEPLSPSRMEDERIEVARNWSDRTR